MVMEYGTTKVCSACAAGRQWGQKSYVCIEYIAHRWRWKVKLKDFSARGVPARRCHRQRGPVQDTFCSKLMSWKYFIIYFILYFHSIFHKILQCVNSTSTILCHCHRGGSLGSDFMLQNYVYFRYSFHSKMPL